MSPVKTWRVGAGLCALVFTVALAGCSAKTFSTPVVWSTNEVTVGDPYGDHDFNETPTVSVRLDGAGEATLENMPTGAAESEDGQSCLSSTDDTYTGPGTWERQGDDALALTYGNSELVVNSDYTFRDPDWSAILFTECRGGKDRSWELTVRCGRAYPDAKPADVTPCPSEIVKTMVHAP